jgi:hypothetical protein
MPSAASIAPARNDSWSVAQVGRPVKKSNPPARLGKPASLWFSISLGRTPNTHSSVGVVKNSRAATSAVICRLPCRGRWSACSRGR